jgi:hypothetical protein
MNKFDVYKLPETLPFEIPENKHWSFNSAFDVALFMFGHYNSKYAIYKDGKLAVHTFMFPKPEHLQKYLEGDIDFPSVDEKQILSGEE